MSVIPLPPVSDKPEEVRVFRELLIQYLKDMKIDKLNLTVSDPPTQAEVQSIANKLDELIGVVDE